MKIIKRYKPKPTRNANQEEKRLKPLKVMGKATTNPRNKIKTPEKISGP
jgi:hypothetical protein